MKQRVCTIGRYEDIVKNDYERLKEIFKKGYHLLKRREDRSWEILKFNWNTLQLLWFCSEDYSKFITDIEYWKGLPVKYVFELRGDNLNNIEQLIEIKEKMELNENQIYIKLTNVNKETNISKVMEILKDKKIERLCLDFEDPINLNGNIISIVATATALGNKMNIKVSSNNHKEFSEPNRWISGDPAISGNIMAEVLNLRMTRQRDNFNRENEYSHKAVELLGIGETFKEGDRLTPAVKRKWEEVK